MKMYEKLSGLKFFTIPYVHCVDWHVIFFCSRQLFLVQLTEILLY